MIIHYNCTIGSILLRCAVLFSCSSNESGVSGVVICGDCVCCVVCCRYDLHQKECPESSTAGEGYR